MDVDLRDLELLETLGTHETLTAAARHLYVSQPALSQRLIRLEERLSTQLFERRGRRLVLNPAGKRMLQAAQTMLAELRSAQRDVRDLVDGRRQPVRLMSQCSNNYQWLPDILRSFRESVPGAEVRIESVPDDDLITALLDERLDVAIVTKLSRQMDAVRLERLFDDEMRAVVAANHPLADREYLSAADFADLHLVVYDTYDPLRAPAIPLPIPPGAQPARVTTVPVVTDLMMEMVASGDHVSILPSWILAPHLEPYDLTTLQVGTTPIARTWYCATRHGQSTEAVDVLSRLIVEHFARDKPASQSGRSPTTS
jgi:LysR family transcriptional regulator, regulator for metE and metH